MSHDNPSAGGRPFDSLRSPTPGKYDERPLSRLQALLWQERQDLWVVVIYSVGVGLMTLAAPVAVQAVVNTIAFGSLTQPLAVLTLLVFAALGFSAGMNALRVYTVEIIQRRLFVQATSDFAQRIVQVKADVFDRLHGPELVNRFFDVATVQKSAAALLVEGLSLLMQTLLGLILLAVYHPLLLAFDILLVFSICVIIFFFGRGATATAIKESKAKYEIAAWLEEMAGRVEAFKSRSGADYALDRADRLAGEYVERRRSHFRIVLRQIIGALALQAAASGALLGIGGFLVMQGQLTLGQLVAAELIVTAAVNGFSKFGKKLETFYDLQAALDKLGQVIDLPLESQGGSEPQAPGGPAAVELRAAKPSSGVSRWTLRAEPGERVWVHGPDDGQARGLGDLLSGLRSASEGTVCLDGLDSRELSPVWLREHAVRLRRPHIFAGTALENLTMNRPEIGVPQAHEALRSVGLLDHLMTLPDGIKTKLNPGGFPLNTEQQVKLALARIIAARPRLLVVDRTFDLIGDDEERQRLFDVLCNPAAPWTLLYLASQDDPPPGFTRVLQLKSLDPEEVSR